MGISNWIPNRIGGEAGYECPLCSLSLDSEYQNCPACGYSDVQRA